MPSTSPERTWNVHGLTSGARLTPGRPAPATPADAEHLARADLERARLDLGRAADPAHVEDHVRAGRGTVGVELVDLAADHLLHELGLGGAGRQAGRHRGA